MENKRAIVISIICFTISLLLITAYVRVKRGELTADFGEEVTVVVATKTIKEFELIRPDLVTTKTVFKNFRQPQTAVDPADIIGKSTYVMIYPDEQITLTKLIHQDGKPVLERQVEKKMRAVTVGISPSTGVANLIRPGNRVDVLTIVNYEQEGTTLFEVKTVVQNALVLATGRMIQNSVPTRVDRDVLNYIEEKFEERRRRDFGGGDITSQPTSRVDDRYSNITLQLSPEDAERIHYLVARFGEARLHMALRNNADQAIEKVDTTLLDDVLGPDSDYGNSKRKPPPLPPPKPPRFYDSKGGQIVPVD